MQSVILAAGMGSRLKKLTQDNTKCMIQVNGVTLIERMLRQLDKQDMSRIVIVVGYRGDQLIEYISELNIKTPIVYVENPIYDKTNNIYSLALAKEHLLQEDTILLESDLIFEDKILTDLIEDERETLALVDKYESWMDGTVIRLNDEDEILEFIPGTKFIFEQIRNYYKTVNIYKFSKSFSQTHYVPFLEAYSMALGNNEYYEQVLRVITMLDSPEIRAKRLNGESWYEVDDVQDLDIASVIFHPEEERKGELLRRRYGGYWRYPKTIDFCYLQNPYFPPTRLLDEIKANVEKLICSYPSGLRVNTLLASKYYDIEEDHIIIGNGASELIKGLMSGLQGVTGVVNPSFEEYERRAQKNGCVQFVPSHSDFSFEIDDVIQFFGDKGISNLVLSNPNFPTGHYLPMMEIMKLLDWCKERSIRLVIDESFVDYSYEKNATLLQDEILDANPHLYVVKSISKAHGVPGLRLGVLGSSDSEMIRFLKNDITIWNINSLAEFYMQIIGKYQKLYIKSLDLVREAREMLADGIKNLPNIRVLPSQGNFLMIEFMNGLNARDITNALLKENRLFIKDLSHKPIYEGRQYATIAVRNIDDNKLLLQCLENLLRRDNNANN